MHEAAPKVLKHDATRLATDRFSVLNWKFHLINLILLTILYIVHKKHEKRDYDSKKNS